MNKETDTEALKKQAEKVRQNARRQAAKLGHDLGVFWTFEKATDPHLTGAHRQYANGAVCVQCGAGCKIVKVDEWQISGAASEQTCDLLKRQREAIASAAITTHPDEGFLMVSHYNAAEQPGAPAVELDLNSLTQALEENLVDPTTDPQLFEIDANPPQSGPIVIVSEITQAGAEAVMEEGGSCETVHGFGIQSAAVEITFPPGTVEDVLEGRGCLGRGEAHEGDCILTGHLAGFVAMRLYVLPSGKSLSVAAAHNHRSAALGYAEIAPPGDRLWLHTERMTGILREAHAERLAQFDRAEAALGRVFVETTEKLKPRLAIVDGIDLRRPAHMPIQSRRIGIMPGLMLALGIVAPTLEERRYPGRPAVPPLRPPEVQRDAEGQTAIDRVVQQSALLSAADDWHRARDPGQQVRTTLSREAAAERKRRNKAQRAARKKNR